MEVKRLAVMAFAIAVSIGTAGASPVVGAPPPGHGPRPAELTPSAVEQVAPWTGTAAEGERSGIEQTDKADERSEAYQREKAAAVQSAAPAGAEKAAPGATLGAPPQIAAAVPVAFTVFDQPASGGLTPPDTIVGKGPGRVLSAVNSAIRLTTDTGANLHFTTLNTFFGATANGDVVDPKVYYDTLGPNDRFYVTGMQRAGRDDADPANDVSRIWVAVSRTPTPSSLFADQWCRYNLEGRRNVGGADASWADRPEIGAGMDTFSFAADQFRFTDRSYTFNVIRVANKTTLANNQFSCPNLSSFSFQPAAAAGDTTRIHIGPAQHYTAPTSFVGTQNPAYFLSHNSGTGTAYQVYRVRNMASGAPTLATLTVTGASYGTPPDSPQPGSAVVIDTGNGRYDQVAAIGNTVTGIFTTVCNFTTGTPNESCTRTPRFLVGQGAGGALTATLQENTFAGYNDGIFAHHASIAINANLQVGSTWQFSGSGFFLGAEARIKDTGGSWSGVSTYAGGSCALPESAAGSGSSRSGDYAGAHTDPVGMLSMWQAGEQAVTIGGTCQWRVRVARLDP
ncbi:MAG TPA: hypothetical protein VF062_21600 [Candidatus Limnocylindrales bacterium]